VIVDAHHHLWDPGRRPYPWMTGAYAPLAEKFGTEELRAVARAAGVSATVAVQASATEEETRDLLAAAHGSGGLIAGVVGWVDLTAPDVPERLAALGAAAGGDRLVGIRHQVQDEPDPAAWLARADVRRGLQAVAAAGLVYDVLIFPPELPAARALAEDIPELPLVLDHAAKPRIAEGAWEPWSSDLGALAEYDHVSAKLSGLVTEAPWDRWRETGIERYAARLVEAFGPDRTMWGSDWPVCTLAAAYADVLALAERVIAGLGPADRAAVLGGTATRVYGL
jgi:L-fuconolactonase